MATGAFSRNISKLFSELKLVPDKLFTNCLQQLAMLIVACFLAQFPAGELAETG